MLARLTLFSLYIIASQGFDQSYNESFSKSMTYLAAAAHCGASDITSWTCVPCSSVRDG